jgi:uncharacterized protein (TIGR02646 family)
MQFIDKSHTEPANWNVWLTTGTGKRSYNYALDYSALRSISNAKQFLLTEQNYLCAYCQSKLTQQTASIEHFIPKSKNVNLSTNYHNLIAVCADSPKDIYGRKHCDKIRDNKLLAPIIYYNDSQVSSIRNNPYFTVYQDGTITSKQTSKDENTKRQVDAFIDILNLNHENLKSKRSQETLKPIMDIYLKLPNREKNAFLSNRFNQILADPTQPYRQYLLIYIASRLNIN